MWGPQSTTETRLVVHTDAGVCVNSHHLAYDLHSCQERVYDHTEYEEQLFYFNTNTRMSCFPHNVKATGMPRPTRLFLAVAELLHRRN